MQDVVVQLENMRNADTQYYIIINAYKPYMLKKHPLTRKQSLVVQVTLITDTIAFLIETVL